MLNSEDLNRLHQISIKISQIKYKKILEKVRYENISLDNNFFDFFSQEIRSNNSFSNYIDFLKFYLLDNDKFRD